VHGRCNLQLILMFGLSHGRIICSQEAVSGFWWNVETRNNNWLNVSGTGLFTLINTVKCGSVDMWSHCTGYTCFVVSTFLDLRVLYSAARCKLLAKSRHGYRRLVSRYTCFAFRCRNERRYHKLSPSAATEGPTRRAIDARKSLIAFHPSPAPTPIYI